MNLKLPATKGAKELYEQLADKGFENDGTQALIKLWWPNGHRQNNNFKKSNSWLNYWILY